MTAAAQHIEQSAFYGVIARWCRRRRKRLKLTRPQLAAHCGIGAGTIASIENQDQRVYAHQVFVLEQTFKALASSKRGDVR